MSKNTDPGAARHGNFINYYQFNPPEKRIELLLPFAFDLQCDRDVICLDLGCNVGELTNSLHQTVSGILKELPNNVAKCYILALDIDPILIQRAEQNNASDQITYRCNDVLSKSFRGEVESFLKNHNRTKFDLIFCFSLTMWIHLNHGDFGLKMFLSNTTSVAEMLLLEPQPWKCYKRAMRRMKKCNKDQFAEFHHLKMRENIEKDIESILTGECGFHKVYETDKSPWGRKIYIFKAHCSELQ